MYVPGPAAASSAQSGLALIDRKGLVAPLKVPPDVYETRRVSPDGTRLAFGKSDGKQEVVSTFEMSGAERGAAAHVRREHPPSVHRHAPSEDPDSSRRTTLHALVANSSTTAPKLREILYIMALYAPSVAGKTEYPRPGYTCAMRPWPRGRGRRTHKDREKKEDRQWLGHYRQQRPAATADFLGTLMASLSSLRLTMRRRALQRAG